MPTIRRMTPTALMSMPSASAVTPQARTAPTAIMRMLIEIPIAAPLSPTRAFLSLRFLRGEDDVPGDVRVAAAGPLLQAPQDEARARDGADDLAQSGGREVVAPPAAERVEAGGGRVVVVKEEHAASSERGGDAAGPRVEGPDAGERPLAGVDEVPAPEQELGR